MQKAREKIRPPKGGQNLVKVLAICHLQLITAVESKSWNEMLIFQQTSEEILNATLDMDTEEVAD